MLFFLIFSNTATALASSAGQWTATGNMNTPRQRASAILLNNGKVLVAGGDVNGATILPDSASAELFNSSTGVWTATGSMNTPRTAFTVTLLQNGKVLAAGGTYTNSAELYDPSTGFWTATGSMNDRRNFHTAILLNNGKVLVAGGTLPGGGPNFNQGNNSAELYDPTAGIWSNTGSLNHSSINHTLTLLPNGKVLRAGGFNNSEYVPTGDVYDPASGTWSATDVMVYARQYHTATLLSNGQVIVAGGGNGALGTIANSELFSTNAPPVINSLPNATINEGDTYTATGSFSDTDSTSWTGTVDYGDGAGPQLLSLNPDKTFSLNHLYKDNQANNAPYTVTVKITDNQGATGTGSAAVTVKNVPPTVGTITAPTNPVKVNTSSTASATFTDPGVLDTHTATWNWGDGATTVGTVTESNGSGSVSNSHTCTVAGNYTIKLTVTDKDGGVGVNQFQYVEVYDPAAGSLGGIGSFTSPTGAYPINPLATGPVSFVTSATYQNNALTGVT